MTYQYVNVNGQYYDEMCRRLSREHNITIHARTRERIDGCTSDDKPTVNHKVKRQIQLSKYPDRSTKEGHPYGHLGRFTTVAYHRATNMVQKRGKFVVQPLSKEIRQLLKITPTDTTILNLKLVGDLAYKKTSQYKTVWNTKGQRRSKA